jgi:pimeloyl-ACP methyl ester carboxylesterase
MLASLPLETLPEWPASTRRPATLTAYEPPGGGEPVLILHGGPGCPDHLGPVAALLPGRRVVRFGQRGTGASVTANRRLLVENYRSGS